MLWVVVYIQPRIYIYIYIYSRLYMDKVYSDNIEQKPDFMKFLIEK